MLTLHVLPRNEEWEYAREFINVSEVLDDDRKEAFLHTLDGLLDEKERGTQRAAELQREKEEDLDRQKREQERNEQDTAEQQQPPSSNHHRRTGSEVDYGIEKSNPNGSTKSPRTPKSALKPSNKAAAAPSSSTPTPSSPANGKQQHAANKRSTAAPGPATQRRASSSLSRLRALASFLLTLIKTTGRSMTTNPLSFLRTLLLALGFMMALGRPDVRERIRRVTGAGWAKVRSTVGMGVKVSYI